MRSRRVSIITFYIFLFVGFFCLTVLTSQNLSAKLALFGFGYGDLISLQKNLANNQTLETYKGVTFVGDVMLARHVETLILRHGEGYPFKKISFLDQTNSYVVGNFESSIPESHVKTPDFHMSFSVHEKYIPQLKNFGFTHLSLANNHSNDFGDQGFKNTEKILQNNDLVALGHSRVLSTSSVAFLDLPEKKVAIIALHTLFVKPNDKDLVSVMNYAKENSDFQIIYVHWGDEYKLVQNHGQRELAKKLIGLGADLIVGHHPHVVQGIEKIDGVLVIYSLGNFIFDQYFSSSVKEGLVLNLNLSNNTHLKLSPVISRYASSQPEFMTSKEKEVFLRKLADRSSVELRGQIMAGELILP